MDRSAPREEVGPDGFSWSAHMCFLCADAFSACSTDFSEPRPCVTSINGEREAG